MIKLVDNVLETIKWYFSLGNKLLRVVPAITICIVFLTLFSQVFLLLASYLPLKVIMLLGSETIPSYFPEFFSSFSRDYLIVILCCLTVIFFLMHLLCEHLIAGRSNAGATILVSKNRKVSLFQGQENVSVKSYQRYARSLAAGIFISLVLALFFFIYAGLAFFILFYVLVVLGVLVAICSASEKIERAIIESYSRVLNILVTIGFLASFSFIVYQYLYGKEVNLLILVVSLLLARQALGKLGGLAKDIYYLGLNKQKLKALFFHKYVLISDRVEYKNNYWDLLCGDNLNRWVASVIEKKSGAIEDLEIKWFQTGVKGVFGFYVNYYDINRNKTNAFLIKLFDKSRKSQASYESTLLLAQNRLPGIKLLSIDSIASFTCHIYEVGNIERVPASKIREAAREIRVALISIEPPQKLVSSYLRSHPCLWGRLNSMALQGVQVAVETLEESVKKQFYEFIENREKVVARLKSLPLTIVNPDLGLDRLVVNDDGQYLAIHWGRWSLEPLGAGWPLDSQEIEFLEYCLFKSEIKRKSLRNVVKSDIYLAAFVFAFEQYCLRQKFVSALQLLPKINAFLKDVPSFVENTQ